MTSLRLTTAAIAAAGVLMCSLIAPASGAEGASEPPKETTSSTTADKDEKVCKKIEMPGSRVSRHKICKTRAEWDAEKQGSDDGKSDKD